MKQQFRILKKEFEWNKEIRTYYVLQRRRKFIFWDDWEKIDVNFDTLEKAQNELNFYVKANQLVDNQINLVEVE